MKHNQRLYAHTIRAWIPLIGDDDLAYLCNKASVLYGRCDRLGGCVDNFRVSRVMPIGKWSPAYAEARGRGCCGFADERFNNPATGNAFYIGFNYGH